jgi:TP901 family phage tail tape measure protein
MRTTGTLNSAMSTTQAAMMALGGSSALAISLMTVEAAKFQREMAMVKSLIGDMSVNEFEKLNRTAKEMAVTFGESPVQVAKGLQMIARAGVTEASDQLEVLTQSMRLAKIEGANIDDIAKTLITTTNLFGDSYANVEKYASKLAQASNISVMTVKDMSNALKYFGGAAREHWNPEETFAAITTLGQQGIEGSLAGTSLRSFTTYLVREMPKSKKALDQLGLTFDDFWQHTESGSREKLKPIEDIVKLFYQASQMKGMTRGDLFKVMSQFGEPRMVQQYMKLFPSEEDMDKGTWQLAKYNKELEKNYDMSDRLSEMMSTTQEKFKQTVSSVQVLAINIGANLLPPLSLALDIFKGLVNILANNRVATFGLAAALTALTVAGVAVVAKWGWGLIANTWAEGTSILSQGIKSLTSNIIIESLAVDKNTASYVANAAARNMAMGGGIGPYATRDVEGWSMTRAERIGKEAGSGRMTAGKGFYGDLSGATDAFFAATMFEDITRGVKGGGIRGMNAPMQVAEWENYVASVLGVKGVDKLKNIPEKGMSRQKFLLNELATEHRKRQGGLLNARQELANLKVFGGEKEAWETAQRNVQAAEINAANTAALMADYNNIIGPRGKEVTARDVLAARGKQVKDFLYKGGTFGEKGIFQNEEWVLKTIQEGEKRYPKGAQIITSAGRGRAGYAFSGVGGQFAAAGAPYAVQEGVTWLPRALAGLPILGTALGVASIAIAGLAMGFIHLGQQVEDNTKKVKKFTDESSKLEKTADQIQARLDKSKPGAPGYFEDLQELHKTNDELDTMYRKIATVNREIYNAKAWQPWNWAEWREQKGPSWYGSLGTSVVGTLTPSKWASGENVSKLLGFEPTFGAKWMSGPQEQMLSEAYKIEQKRQNAIANLNNAHNSQMSTIDEQHKKGRFKSEEEYLKVRNEEVDKYNKKRTTLDKQYDRETGKVVGPQNVDATRRLYQMEERLKTARLQMINAIMKMLDVIMKIILLPLTIFGGGAFKATGGDNVTDKTENLSDQINRMAKEMETAAKRLENFAEAINNIANPILYTIYVISHFVAFMKGLISWAINPVNWFTKKPPSPIPEGYGTWLDKNKEGKDHYDPSQLEDNALKKGYEWVASGQAGQDIEAGVKDIPNKIRGGIKTTKDKITGAYRYVTGTPARIWNSLFGPKDRKTPEERRIEEEARKAGKKPGEYFPTAEDKREKEKEKEGIVAPQQKPEGQEQPTGIPPREKGLQYGLHSPFTINAGTSGSMAGASTLIFPDLDPKKMKETAKGTAKDILGSIGSSGGDGGVEGLLRQMNATLNKIATNTANIGSGEGSPGFKEKAKKKWEEAKEKAGEKGQEFWEKAKQKGFEGVYGKETPSGQTYLGKDIPKREGGLLGEGGLKDKARDLWENTDNKRRAGLEETLFGKDTGFDLGTGNLRKKGGIFGREGTLENLLGKEHTGQYRDILGKAEGAIFGKGGKGGIAGFFGREGEGDWKTLSETFGSEGLGGQIFGKGKGIFNNIMNTASKVGDKGLGGVAGKLFGKGGIAGKVLGKGGLGGLAGRFLGKGGYVGQLAKVGGSLIKKIPGVGTIASIGSQIMDMMTGQATIGTTVSNIINAIPGVGTVAGFLGDALGGGIDAVAGMAGGLFKGKGGLAGMLSMIPGFGLLGNLFGFKKHSPFTVWKGQAGMLPGSMPGAGNEFSIKFPELDAEKLAEKVKDAGRQIAVQKTTGGISIENLIIQRASEDPEEIQRILRIGLNDLARELEGT